MAFQTAYEQILKQLQAFDPKAYARSRNFKDGQVSRLSPYISRGVISTRFVAQTVLQKGYSVTEIQKFIQELAWRDYFQQVWMAIGDEINTDIKQTQTHVSHHHIPENILKAKTSIHAIDTGIDELYTTGYMHNHMRMYVAALSCNLGQSHWKTPAKWMYYHLLDADWASNALSWQWIAGSFSHKKYIANQENVNRYFDTDQTGTFLDQSYEELTTWKIPKELESTTVLELKTKLPEPAAISIDTDLPTYIYNFYNLDPNWGKSTKANRILLLEPEFFSQYPVRDKTISFVLDLAQNIENIQVYVGSFDALKTKYNLKNIHFKEHPTNRHYTGAAHAREWLFPDVTGYHASFSQFWKKAQKQLDQLTDF